MAEREMIKRTPLKRSTKPIRSRSKKTEKIYVKRRKFVAEFLEKHPWCQRCYEAFPETQSFVNRSTEVHEVISRARGGDILEDLHNIQEVETRTESVNRWTTEEPPCPCDS